MPEIVVAAESRTESGKNANRRLRAAGKIPGVLYGTGKVATAVAVSPKEIGSILKSAAGENTLFDLEIGGTRRKVILKEFQVEPLKSRLLHADFYEVALDKAIEVKVHIELHGVPVGVKVEGGILDFVTRELEISCLPTDIPAKIEVDVSHLELGKHLRVSDLKIPEQGRGARPSPAWWSPTWWRRGPRKRSLRPPRWWRARRVRWPSPRSSRRARRRPRARARRARRARRPRSPRRRRRRRRSSCGWSLASATRASAIAGRATTPASWRWTRSWRARPGPGSGRPSTHGRPTSPWAAAEVRLAKPLTFMNRSGAAVARLLDEAALQPADLVVVVDDVALELSTLRVRERGSHGGHNGLRSLIDTLGTEEFPRVRIGVRRGDLPEDLAEYVLSEFPPDEVLIVQEAVGAAADAVECLLLEGVAVAMNRFNGSRRSTSESRGGSSYPS